MARPSLRLIAALSVGLTLGPVHWAMAEYPVYDSPAYGEHKPDEPVPLPGKPGGYVLYDERTFQTVLACFPSTRDEVEKSTLFLQNPALREKTEAMYCLKFRNVTDVAKWRGRLQAEWGTLWR